MNEALKQKLNSLSPEQLKALMQKLGKEKKELPKMPVNPENRYPLSSAQKRMWFLSKLDPEAFLYTNPIAIRLKVEADFDQELYIKSFQAVTQRHDIMRTSFGSEGGKLYQTIHPEVPAAVLKTDLRNFSISEQTEIIEDILRKEGRAGIDVEAFPLFRHSILQVADREFIFVYTSHHIISDAWSSSKLFREALQVYFTAENGKPGKLPPLKYQFIDYVKWENNWLNSTDYAKKLAAWKILIPHDPEPLNLPFDFKKPVAIRYEGALEKATLNTDLVTKLKDFSRQKNVNVFHTLLAVFNVLLHKYSGNEEVVVGIPLANRTVKEFQEAVGLFLNTLPHRTLVAETETFETYLSQVKEISQTVFLNQELPFEKLIDEIKPRRDVSVSPVFQVLFVYQNIPMLYEADGMVLSPEKADIGVSKYPLGLWLEDVNGELFLSLTYQTSLFKQATIQRFLKHFEFLLNEAISHPETKIENLRLEIPQGIEIQTLDFPEETWLSDFEKQVGLNGSKPAVRFGGATLTYAELNNQANQLAHYLLKKAPETDEVTAMVLDRSEKLISTILGIHKSGAAYLPIEPSVPDQRLHFLLEDAGVCRVITEAKYQSRFDQSKYQLLLIDEQATELLQNRTENPEKLVLPESLAYVIYTSGSTGQPKGVCIEHRNLANYSNAIWKCIGLESGSSFASISSIATDSGNTQIFPVLMNGGFIDMLPDETLTDAKLMAKHLSTHQTDCLKLAPSLFSSLFNVFPELALLPQKLLIFGGEKIPAVLILKIRSLNKNLRIINQYGPTETTVGILTHEITNVQANSIIPLGKALTNNTVVIAGKNGNLQPDGIAGEIIITGKNVSRGYLNRPELTEKAFNSNSDNPEIWSYKTGDLGRRLADGTIEFLGRIDQQLKIRGYRVEPEEIEKAILKNQSVAQAVVMAASENSLTAYIVPALNQEPDLSRLRQELKAVLPEYMVPSELCILETLPRLGNGKLNLQKLKEQRPEKSTAVTETSVMPRDETELALSHIWQEVLKLNSVSINDNYFEVGGNSLAAIELIGKINQQFQADLAVGILFESNTICLLAKRLRNTNQKAGNNLVLLRPGTSGKTVFLVHPAGGSIFCYYELAHQLPAKYPVYGIQALSSDYDESISEMAKRYLKAIQSEFPEAGYVFGGWSMGAVIAYEMALQLEQKSGKSAPVIMLDQQAPETNVPAAEINPLERLETFAGKVGQLAGRKLHITAAILARLSEQEQSALFLKEFQLSNLVPEEVKPADFQGYLEQTIRHHDLSMSYRPGNNSGNVLLLKAADSENSITNSETEESYGWQKYATNLKTKTVSGNHVTIMKMPAVKSVAAAFNSILEPAEANTQTPVN